MQRYKFKFSRKSKGSRDHPRHWASLLWEGLAALLLGLSLVAPQPGLAQTAGSGGSVSLDKPDEGIVHLDSLVGSEVQPYARLTVTNRQSSQSVLLTVKAGTILSPTTEASKFYELVLVEQQFRLEAGKTATLSLNAYLGDLGNGSKTAAGSKINFVVQSLEANPASKTAAEVLGRATARKRTPGDNAVQLGLWMALGKLSFDELQAFFPADISSFHQEAEDFRGPLTPPTQTSGPLTAAPVTTGGGGSSPTVSAAGASTPTLAAPGPTPTAGSAVETTVGPPTGLIIAIVVVGVGLLVTLVGFVLVVLHNNQRQLEERDRLTEERDRLAEERDQRLREELGLEPGPNGVGQITGGSMGTTPTSTPARTTLPPTQAPRRAAKEVPNSPFKPGPILAEGDHTAELEPIPPPFGAPTWAQADAKGKAANSRPADDDEFEDTGEAASYSATDLRNPPPAQAGPNRAIKPTLLLKVEGNKEYLDRLAELSQDDNSKNLGFEIDLAQPRVILTRLKFNYLVLEGNNTISAPHAILEFRDKNDPHKLFVTDLLSTHGTFVLNHPTVLYDWDGHDLNGQILPHQRDFELVPDEIGQVRLRFGTAGYIYYWDEKRLVTDNSSGRARSFDLSGSKRWVVSRLELPIQELRVAGKDGGKNPYSDDLISTPHALLKLDRDRVGVQISDLNSKHGLQIEEESGTLAASGRQEVKNKPLRLGQKFRLGNTTFKLLNLSQLLESLRSDRALEKYEINSVPLGGGMGHVYLCRRRDDGQQFALKIPRPEKILNREDYQESFANEQKAIRQFGTSEAAARSGIVGGLEFGHIRSLDVPFHIMKYVDGVSLREVINWQAARNPPVLPIEQVLYIIRNLLDALGYVHYNAGLVHCDVSGGNVMLDRESKIWLTDFGITTPIGQNPPHFLNKQYAAPEMSGQSGTTRQVSEATDLFSVGMLLYHLAESPFGKPGDLMDQPNTEDGRSKSEAVLKQKGPLLDPTDTVGVQVGQGTDDVSPASEDKYVEANRATEVVARPQNLRQVRRKCMQTAPTDRYPNVGAMLADLDRLYPPPTSSQEGAVRVALKRLVEEVSGRKK